MMQLGELVRVTDKELILKNASWIADSGRFSTALETGSLIEIEKIPNSIQPIINRGAICDAFEWLHELPINTK